MTWRISPLGWVAVVLATVAVSGSNGLRAYGLGAHLEQFAVSIYGHAVSLSGVLMVAAAVALTITQTRAAWVAVTPGPARQRWIAGIAATVLVAVSMTAFASHLFKAQRFEATDETGARGQYDRAKAAYDKAAAELQSLGSPRPVAVVQADVQAVKIDMTVWRRSAQCSDISREDTKAACQPVLDLYKERGASARKAELEPQVSRLRAELAALKAPKVQSTSEASIVWWWAWIMAVAVVWVETFAAVIFAKVAPVQVQEVVATLPEAAVVASSPVPPVPSRKRRNDRKDKVESWVRDYTLEHGHPPAFSVVKGRFRLPKATASRYLKSASAA